MKKRIILSYDYELFFGDRSGTVQKSLIEPTNQLLDAMDSVGFKGNFFIDWQMIKYLSMEDDNRCKQDYDAIVNQLKDIVHRGHRIELHIHPHWVDAKYNGDGTWNFNEFEHYSLNSFTKDEITEMFVGGTNLLESIAREVEPDYKIVAFRAGGWAVQPFDMLKEGFIKAGIKVEASVAVGVYGKNLHSQYDFRIAPNKDLYRFDDDVCREVHNGAYIEVPITCFERKFINKVFDKLTNLTTNWLAFITDGTHVRKEDMEENSAGVFNSLIQRGMLGFRMCPLNSPLYVIELGHYITCFLHHPKDQTKASVMCIKMLSFVSKSITYKDIVDNEK